jgi:chromosome segregation ATPase
MGDDAATVEQLRAELRQYRELRTADQAEMASLRAELEQRNAELQASNRQVSESLEQQTALSEVLSVIASSPTDLDGVLAALAEALGVSMDVLWYGEAEAARIARERGGPGPA